MTHENAARVRVGGVVLVAAVVAITAIAWLGSDDSTDFADRAKAFVRTRRPCKPQPPREPGLVAHRFYMLEELAKHELEAGRLDKADALATELLDLAPSNKDDWNYGNAIHHGHMVRGLVALARGNVEEAKRRLLASGETPGSPQLNSFGPSMALAEALLERGEPAVVLQFLERCGRFWKLDHNALVRWRTQIRRNRMPDFLPNVCY